MRTCSGRHEATCTSAAQKQRGRRCYSPPPGAEQQQRDFALSHLVGLEERDLRRRPPEVQRADGHVAGGLRRARALALRQELPAQEVHGRPAVDALLSPSSSSSTPSKTPTHHVTAGMRVRWKVQSVDGTPVFGYGGYVLSEAESSH